jgi:hypothetical protein
MSVVGQECSAAESSKLTQVIVKKPVDNGNDTSGTKNAIDIAGRMPIVDLPLIFPRPNPTGSTHRMTFEMDGLSGRCPLGNMGKRSLFPSSEFTRGGGASGESGRWIRVCK